MTIDLNEEYNQLGAFYDTFARLIDEPDERLFRANADVSGWSPAQHLHHILIANGMMLKGVQLICRGASMVLPEGGPNRLGLAMLTGGSFPRGGQAPDAVIPPETLTRDDLHQTMTRSRNRYEAFAETIPAIPEAQGYLPHAFFGQLDAAQWLRLARVHSDHHLTIIREILA